MRHYDFSPLYHSAIGFDRMANLLDGLVASQPTRTNYPPYNIEQKSDDEYRISMAVAGFSQSELNIETEQNSLKISGVKEEGGEERRYLHQGIAARNFERRFELADYVRVEKASYENGLLHIDLVRELPEVMKPRTIAIESDDDNVQTLEKSQQQEAA